MTATPIVDHLHIVELALTVSSIQDLGAGGTKAKLKFLYGIGTQGLTAFEKRMHGKAPGDTLAVHVDSSTLAPDFEHLGRLMLEAVGSTLPLDLAVEIKSVRRATDLEVVKELARQGESGGCGGGCGCGC